MKFTCMFWTQNVYISKEMTLFKFQWKTLKFIILLKDIKNESTKCCRSVKIVPTSLMQNFGE